MSRKWKRNATVLVVAMLVLWASPGCPGSDELSEDDSISSADEGSEVSRAARVSAARATEIRGDTTDWPDGWLVVKQEEWIPVLDELGRSLHAARSAFQSGDRAAAAAEVQRGIGFLEAQLSETSVSVRDRAALASARATLRALADRLSAGETVTLQQLDIAFANAYRFNLEREALVVDLGTSQPYLDRPETHLQRAVDQYLADETEEAAREIDRASAYLRLEGNRHDAVERAQLVEAAQDLEHVAARVRVLEIRDRTELDRVFEPVVRQWRQLARAPAPARSLGLMNQ